MSKNKKIVWGIVGVIVLVLVFFIGVAYGKSQTPASPATAYTGARTRGAGGFGGATIGQIISKDATSITVQLMTAPGGTAATSTTPVGSKIVFVDSNTKISKQVDGTLSDLAVGATVSVTGTANPDGSVTATAVQIRPAISARNTTP
jgi:hypothetical protein